MVKFLTKIYKTDAETVNALNSIDLSISSGQFLSIMGQSGSGKSRVLLGEHDHQVKSKNVDGILDLIVKYFNDLNNNADYKSINKIKSINIELDQVFETGIDYDKVIKNIIRFD